MFFRRIISFLLVILLPMQGLEASDQVILAKLISRPKAIWKAPPSQLTYDNILEFIHELESGALEKRCNEEDLNAINLFLCRLAQRSLSPNDSGAAQRLTRSMESLLYEDTTSFEYDTDRSYLYQLRPAISHDLSKSELQKVGLRRAWRKTKRWSKKHKKALIIGAVVVAVAAIVVTVAVASASSAAATGAAAASGATGTSTATGPAAAIGGAAAAAGAAAASKDKKEREDEREEPAPRVDPISGVGHTKPQIATVVEDRCNEMKTSIQEVTAKNKAPITDTDLENMGRFYGAAAAELAHRDGAEEAKSNPDLAREMALDISNPDRLDAQCDNAKKAIEDSFAIDKASLTPAGAALLAGRAAAKLPIPVPAKAVAAVGAAAGAAAFVATNPEEAKKAFESVKEGANYLYNQASEFIESHKKDFDLSFQSKKQELSESELSGSQAELFEGEYFEGFPDRPCLKIRELTSLPLKQMLLIRS